jgi:hypothetical protein
MWRFTEDEIARVSNYCRLRALELPEIFGVKWPIQPARKISVKVCPGKGTGELPKPCSSRGDNDDRSDDLKVVKEENDIAEGSPRNQVDLSGSASIKIKKEFDDENDDDDDDDEKGCEDDLRKDVKSVRQLPNPRKRVRQSMLPESTDGAELVYACAESLANHVNRCEWFAESMAETFGCCRSGGPSDDRVIAAEDKKNVTLLHGDSDGPTLSKPTRAARRSTKTITWDHQLDEIVLILKP